MEAVGSLKQIGHSPDLEVCLICQETRSEKLRKGVQQGLATLKCAAHTRDKLCDTGNKPAIDRIKEISSTDVDQLWWHKSCYSTFTSKDKIERLQPHPQ